MATRALIGTIQTDAAGNQILTSTYNHYDGYPESLGVALNKFYSGPNEAVKISSTGYISYLDSKTGEIEAKHQEPAGKDILSDSFREAMMGVAEIGDEYGASYIYIYNVETSKWVNASLNRGIRGAAEQLARNLAELDGVQFDVYGGDDLADVDSIQNMEENYKTKWQDFITENQAIDDQWVLYVKSLVNDIRLNGINDYSQFSESDFKEDFDNYIADKMGI